jgi:hypothetical protein
LENYQSGYCFVTKIPPISHKTALFCTFAHFSGSVVYGQANSRSEKRQIANETNDLAHLSQTPRNKNIEQN